MEASRTRARKIVAMTSFELINTYIIIMNLLGISVKDSTSTLDRPKSPS
jgi:hypothetical protein